MSQDLAEEAREKGMWERTASAYSGTSQTVDPLLFFLILSLSEMRALGAPIHIS